MATEPRAKAHRLKAMAQRQQRRKLNASTPNYFLSAAARLVGRRFADSWQEMLTAQWLPANELNPRNEERLGALLSHSAENVPFYRALYRKLGIAPADLRTAKDLSALPVLSKADYRRAVEDFYAVNLPPYRRIERSTSGSTGVPFAFCLDRTAFPVIFASHLFYDSWHGIRPFDKYIRIASPPATSIPLASKTPINVRLQQAMTGYLQYLFESWTQQKIALWEVDAARAMDIWKRIESFRPKFLMGYTSAVATIADELLHRNLRLSNPLQAVITMAETLSPLRKRSIQQYFEAPIVNRYGLREFGSWSAQSCPESPDQFHVNTELVVCEILRQDGSACEPREVGQVVLTDLHNYVRPFIRYNTGDLAMAAAGDCTCGRGFPLLGPIEGRSQECLRTPSGKMISPVVLGHYLFVYHDHQESVRHYQLVQESSDRVFLLVVPTDRWSNAAHTRLRDDLAKLVGDDMEVSLETVSEIPPEKSGKRPIIKIANKLSD
jgi:phenylacetate-CoA ligase